MHNPCISLRLKLFDWHPNSKKDSEPSKSIIIGLDKHRVAVNDVEKGACYRLLKSQNVRSKWPKHLACSRNRLRIKFGVAKIRLECRYSWNGWRATFPGEQNLVSKHWCSRFWLAWCIYDSRLQIWCCLKRIESFYPSKLIAKRSQSACQYVRKLDWVAGKNCRSNLNIWKHLDANLSLLRHRVCATWPSFRVFPQNSKWWRWTSWGREERLGHGFCWLALCSKYADTGYFITESVTTNYSKQLIWHQSVD